MSFLKFWGKKSKSKDLDDHKENDGQTEAEREKSKLRHQLSISRSGRYKQKKWERSGILDKPELFNGNEDSSEDSVQNTDSHSAPTGHSRSPNNTCRNIQQVPGMGLQAGRSSAQTAAV